MSQTLQLHHVSYYPNHLKFNQFLTGIPIVNKCQFLQATLIAKEDGLLKRDKKADRGKTKDQIREEEERVLRQVLIN
jgi:hypothetical protein